MAVFTLWYPCIQVGWVETKGVRVITKSKLVRQLERTKRNPNNYLLTLTLTSPIIDQGHKYLGSILCRKVIVEKLKVSLYFFKSQVDEWINNVNALVKVAKIEPQLAYAADSEQAALSKGQIWSLMTWL